MFSIWFLLNFSMVERIMKEAIEFISKLLKKEDIDFNKLIFCNNSIQCTNGFVTASYPLKFSKKEFSVNGAAVIKAIEICKYKPDLSINKKQLIIKDKTSNFISRLSLIKSNNYLKIKRKKEKELPPDFIKTIAKMLLFTVKDSDHQWAASVNIIKGYLYATNNISVIKTKTKVKLPSCSIPKVLLDVVVKIKEQPISLSISERFITFFYKKESWISCQRIVEEVPDIGAIFNEFKKTTPIHDADLKSLLNAISMTIEGEIKVRNTTIITDTCSIEGTNLSDTKVDSENLEFLLKTFHKVKLGRQLNFFENDTFKAVLASRI